MINLEEFVEKQKSLLALERASEVEEAFVAQTKSSTKELCRRGVALQKLCVSNIRTGLFGRTVVTFRAKIEGQELPSHTITPGDITGVSDGENSGEDQQLSGVVVKVSSNAISVSFQQTADSLSFNETDLYRLVKLANDVTYKRLNAALEKLRTGEASSLQNVLFGISTPSPPHQTLPPCILDANQNLKYHNTGLDESQQAAVVFALKQQELAVIHGPPGTGKTTTIVEIVTQAVRAGDKVLVCAPSNVAVDNLLDRLVKNKVKVVRLGHPARVQQTLQQHSLDALISYSDQTKLVQDIYKELDDITGKIRKSRGSGEKQKLRKEVTDLRKELKQRERKAMKEILCNAQVVLGTLTSSTNDGPLRNVPVEHFSMTVIDECSQSLEMACWIAIPRAPKLLLAGDHLQLPPTIMSCEAASKGLSHTLMERVIDQYGVSVVKMLTTQYRMNSIIMEWSSQALYDGKLTAHQLVENHLLKDLPHVKAADITGIPLLMIDTAGCDMPELNTGEDSSKGNEGEVGLVSAHVKRLIDAGVKQIEIAIITPYNLQVELLRLNLHPKYPDLEIKSVDGFQGREKEAVILSLVRSNEKKEIGFLSERRRLNVAVTRARRHLAVVCDTDTVNKDDFLKEFVKYVADNGELETADMFNVDELVVERPEGLELSGSPLTPVKKKRIKGEMNKIKEVVKKKEMTVQKSVSDDRKVENTNIKKYANDNKKVGKTVISEDNKANEKQLREEFTTILNNLISGSEEEYHFPINLNAFERKLVHEIAENLKLSHESRGEKEERFILVKKPKSVQPVQRKEKYEETVKKSTNAIVCSNCQKEVPKQNIELHIARCRLQTLELVSNREVVKEKRENGKKGKKSKAIEEEDFDAMLSSFQKKDTVCNYPKCKTLIATLGVDCKFCRVRFCLTHAMAEVHGCGDAAKSAARQQLSRDGKWFPGSGSAPRKTDPDKRAQMLRKLDKKLVDLEGERKHKKKGKS